MRGRLIRWALAGTLGMALVLALGYVFLREAQTSGSGYLIERPTRVLPGLESRPEPPSTEGRGHRQKPRGGATKPPPPPQESCDDLRVLVDRDNPLPPGYAPQDLVSLRNHGVPTLPGRMLLRLEAAEQLSRLVRSAAADSQELMVASAYRSHADQRLMFAKFRSMYGKRASWVSARPGQSQHQLGTAVDFTNSASDYRLLGRFGRSGAGRWLLEHAPEYGFVLAYPNSAEAETGIQWEPWHYRYIGVENANRLKRSGLSLQAFLDRGGVRPRC